jgi:predicted alpha-1,6-mannanase (GH76 family)
MSITVRFVCSATIAYCILGALIAPPALFHGPFSLYLDACVPSFLAQCFSVPVATCPKQLFSWLLPYVYEMFFNFFRGVVVLIVGVGVSQTSAAASTSYAANAEAALTELQTWYNTQNGLWNTTGWWNSANCITVLGDLAAVDSNVKAEVTSVFANTIVAAQNYNLAQSKIITPEFNQETIWGPNDQVVAVNPKGFLNGFYDDEGWWALGWIQAYDVTGNTEYLNTAVDIFTDMKNGSSTPCSSGGGGIWWDKANTYVNAIANELYLSVASHLANRVTSQKTFYLGIAEDQWTWFQNSGMINKQSLINDGLTTACKNNNGTVWSYNQGVILGALVELNKAAPSSSYLSTAHSIASAAITALSTNGILHDPCEPNCGADGSQFKGIFMRNLQILQAASPDTSYLTFIQANADSIWANDRNTATNGLSVNWAGPFIGSANASTQSSAMDALVAAVAFNGAGLG